MKFIKGIVIVFTILFSQFVMSQSSCATAINLGTPGSTQSCQNITSGTTGSAPCAGAGYGGSGGVYYVKFCTNATNACVNFSITQGTASGNWAVTIYDASCTTAYDAQCLGNTGTGGTFNTASPAYSPLSPNTCYVARIWVANAGTFNLCTQTLPASNNYCTGATAIGPTNTFYNNFCMTAGSNGSYTEPAPAQFCAGSLENNAWYTFTTSPTCVAPCTVQIIISNIVCNGGGNGFQLGFWSGACSSLTYLGCTSGSAGSLTVTINNLSPGQVITMGMDGNAGANCTYSIQALNTVPVPIELVSFDATVLGNGKVHLKWITAMEKNNDYFVIERSRDGVYFEEVTRVEGAKNSNINISYGAYDPAPLGGISYYRLKQVDTDGSHEYSDLRAVELKGNGKDDEFTLVPNPASGEVSVNFVCKSAANETIHVYDNRGYLVLSKEVVCAEGVNNTKLDISSLRNGIYFVFLNTKDKIYKSKLVVN